MPRVPTAIPDPDETSPDVELTYKRSPLPAGGVGVSVRVKYVYAGVVEFDVVVSEADLPDLAKTQLTQALRAVFRSPAVMAKMTQRGFVP